MKVLNVKKGKILQMEGSKSGKLFEVRSGLLRSYAIDESGKIHTFMFAPEGWIVGDPAPSDKPCLLTIEALEDSVVVEMEKSLVSDIHLHPKKLMKRIEAMQLRIIMLMSYSAKDRYQHFLENYPDIVKRISQRMIASYLGISPERLSYIKREYFENHS